VAAARMAREELTGTGVILDRPRRRVAASDEFAPPSAGTQENLRLLTDYADTVVRP